MFIMSQQLFIREISSDTSHRLSVNLSAGLCSVFLLAGLSDRVIKCLLPRLSDLCMCVCVCAWGLRWVAICINSWGSKSHLYHTDRWRLSTGEACCHGLVLKLLCILNGDWEWLWWTGKSSSFKECHSEVRSHLEHRTGHKTQKRCHKNT